MIVAAVAGRRIDALGARRERFPLSRVPEVRTRIMAALIERGVQCVVSCAACGTDLVAASVAIQLELKLRIVMPVAPEIFLRASVVDRPGQWADLFWSSLAYSRLHGGLVELGFGQVDHLCLLEANRALLRCAHEVARDARPIAIVAWDGMASGPTDYTLDFRALASSESLEIMDISTC